MNDGVANLTVDLDAGGPRLRISAAPRRDPESVSLRIELAGALDAHRTCATAVLIDGVPHAMPIAEYRYEDGFETLRFVESLASLRAFSTATRVAGRICADEWRLDADGKALVTELVARIDEELAFPPPPAASR